MEVRDEEELKPSLYGNGRHNSECRVNEFGVVVVSSSLCSLVRFFFDVRRTSVGKVDTCVVLVLATCANIVEKYVLSNAVLHVAVEKNIVLM